MTLQTEKSINNLCAQALEAKGDQDVERILAELRAALEEHVWRAKVSLASTAALIDPPKV